uniref:Eukaryotic translation initiation factor 5A (eIF-5A) n=1 Tax=Ganoderma boninense TaxID=34458 RepID=A0A5K1JUS6_9APHY|nr:Eukaryotic translation initiation factor 5A (eIF-5A) [Ganoderma boninense]
MAVRPAPVVVDYIVVPGTCGSRAFILLPPPSPFSSPASGRPALCASASQPLAVSRSFTTAPPHYDALSACLPPRSLGLLRRTWSVLLVLILLSRNGADSMPYGYPVLADLNITIGGQNITAAAFLNTNDTIRTVQCNSNCTNAMSAVTISVFDLLPSSITNATPSATAYTTACGNINATVGTALKLSLPADWDGPFGQGLTIGTTVIALGVAFFMGLFSIAVVNSM